MDVCHFTTMRTPMSVVLVLPQEMSCKPFQEASEMLKRLQDDLVTAVKVGWCLIYNVGGVMKALQLHSMIVGSLEASKKAMQGVLYHLQERGANMQARVLEDLASAKPISEAAVTAVLTFSWAATDVCQKEVDAHIPLSEIVRLLKMLFERLGSGKDPAHMNIEKKLRSVQAVMQLFEKERHVVQTALNELRGKFEAACQALNKERLADLGVIMGLSYLRVVLGALFLVDDLVQLDRYLEVPLRIFEDSSAREGSPASVACQGKALELPIRHGQSMPRIGSQAVLQVLVDDIQKSATGYPLGLNGSPAAAHEGSTGMQALASMVEWLDLMLSDVQKNEAQRRRSLLTNL